MSPIDFRTERYGPFEAQEGDLYLPSGPHPAVICLLHGGFWRMPHGRDQVTAVARDLACHGFAAWNLGYRRLGEPGGGWPGTFTDVGAGIEYLVRMVESGLDLDLTRVAVVGHSAGGQLALWAAAHGGAVRISAVAALAAVTDLERAHHLELGGRCVAELLGGAPGECAGRCSQASPMALLPLAVPQLVLHGTADEIVPLELSRAYALAALDAGDGITFQELDGVGHMDYLDPSSGAHAALRAWLLERLDR